jgi:uncharacterized membrane protein
MGSYARAIIPVSKHRMEALADGVFAIAMTLLVLEIKIPDLPRSAASGEIWHAVRHEGPVFFSFLITFILSGAFWYLHQSLLRLLSELRGVLLALNILFLMFVSVLPFSTGMLGRFLTSTFAQEIYFANQFALGILLVLQWRVALAKKLVAEPHSAEAKELPWMLLRFPVGAACAMAVAAVHFFLGFYAFLGGIIVVRVLRRKALKREFKAPAA